MRPSSLAVPKRGGALILRFVVVALVSTVPGSVTGQVALAPAPVADSVAGSWALTGSMGTPRHWHSVTRLADGRVLTAGGSNSSAILASSELYDPATGRFSPTGSMTVPRFGHTAVLLADGRVLVVGGRNATTSELASAEVYDPATGRFTPTASSRVGRLHAGAIPLRTGKALIIGGYTTRCELYDPATGTFTDTGSLHTARQLFSATLLADGTVLAAGTYPWQNSAETYDPASGVWTTTGPMVAGRSEYPSGVLLDSGKVLLAGGTFGLSSELYDPATRTFTRTGDMLNARHNYPLIKLPDGTVLAAGGDPGGSVTTAVSEVYHPATGTWTATGPMVVRRFNHKGVLLADGRALVIGGGDTAATAELYSPVVGGLAAVDLSSTQLSGCLGVRARVVLTGPAPAGGLVVTLHSDSPNVLLPASVTVREGASSKRFTIETLAVAAIETATVRAAAGGTAVSATITLQPMGVKTVLLSPDPVVGGATVHGIVALQCAAGPGDIAVTLSSTKPDIAAPTTATVTIPVGTNFLPFEVTTTPVTAEAKATIAATANGIKKTNALVVTPGP